LVCADHEPNKESEGYFVTQHFDVGIIGSGPAGIFAAYELVKEDPSLKVALIEA